MKSKTGNLVVGAIGIVAGAILGGTRSESRGRRRLLQTDTSNAPQHTPLDEFRLCLHGFHFESGHLERQSRVCMYCAGLDEDLAQCLIFDGPGPRARLIGIEYIISADLFRKLPEEEKRLWHSHVHEIKSGQLAVSGLDRDCELKLLEQFQTTYGKTWYTWNPASKGGPPLGAPKLMMSFTEDNQLRPKLLAERDRLLGISTKENSAKRAGLPETPVEDGADVWEKGEVMQTQLARSGMTFVEKEK